MKNIDWEKVVNVSLKKGIGWGLLLSSLTLALIMPYAFQGLNYVPIPITIQLFAFMVVGAILVK